ncbi:hypothetical protein KCU62_g176, partial [Aureobasidium sp. EXF-3399]
MISACREQHCSCEKKPVPELHVGKVSCRVWGDEEVFVDSSLSRRELKCNQMTVESALHASMARDISFDSLRDACSYFRHIVEFVSLAVEYNSWANPQASHLRSLCGTCIRMDLTGDVAAVLLARQIQVVEHWYVRISILAGSLKLGLIEGKNGESERWGFSIWEAPGRMVAQTVRDGLRRSRGSVSGRGSSSIHGHGKCSDRAKRA